MNAQPSCKRPVSGWSRILAAALFAIGLGVITEFAWDAVREQRLPSIYATVRWLVSAAFSLGVCGTVAFTGQPPRFWTRFEARYAASNAADAPFWRRSAPRPPRWLWHLSLVLLGGLTIVNAFIFTIGQSDRLGSRPVITMLVVVWCLTFGVVGFLISCWRKDAYNRHRA